MPSPSRRSSHRIVLVRHGETEWSLSGQHTGVTDLPLTPAGEEEARVVGEALRSRSFALVLSSPRTRAIDTAALAGFGDRLVVDEDLAEWDYGAYEGLTTSQIVERRGGPWDLWSDGVPPGATPGETAHDVRRRADAVLARASAALEEGDVLLVAHGHILRALAIAWVGLPPGAGRVLAISTSTIGELGFEHDRPVIIRWNAPARF